MHPLPDSAAQVRPQALRIALIYGMFGVLWIALSDAALELWVAPEDITRFQTSKGLAFVTVTAALVFGLVWRQFAANATLTARLEASRAQQERLLDVMVNASPAMVWMSGPDHGRSFFNTTWLRFTGRELAQEVGAGWMEGVHADDRARCARILGEAQEARGVLALEYRLRRHDGEYRWIFDEGTPRFDAAGQFCGYVGSTADITDRRLAEDALRESEERFRATFEQAAVGIAMVSPEGRWLRVNQRFCDIAGYPREELLALGFQDITHPDDRRPDAEAARRVLAGEIDRYSLEKRYQRRDGGSVWVNLTVSLVRTHDGQPKYFIAVAEDIGARRRAEQELADSEERYRYLFERNPLPMWVYDKETLRFLEVNAAAVEHYGYPRERFLAMTLRDIRPPQDVQAMELAAHRRGDEAYGGQWRHLRQDGSVVDVNIWSKRIEFAGRAARLVLAEDVTLGKRAQEARSAAEARYRVLMDLLPYGVQENDAEGRVVYANPALERLQGSSPGGSVGRYIWDFLADAEERPKLRAYLAHLVADQPPPQTYFGRNRRPDGSTVDVQVDWTYDRADDGHVKGFVSVVSDITGHRQAEARLRHLSQQLMQVQEEERRALARELHDEVGQALTALKLSLHAVRRRVSETATLARLADCIEITENTIGQIRDRALDLRPSVLDDLGLTAALEWFLRRQEERSGCRFVLRAEPLVRRPRAGVEIAAFRLVQEAVTNALRHGHASRVDVALTSDEAMLQMTVRDDGCGFRVEQAIRRSREGGGIGLPGMRERVEVMGGRFEVRSRPGKGAEVTATFPLETEEGDGG
ncbi:MAG: PAS domain S-box protein [Betaproteobacteria bacterium]|nr:PAS domain S-box protein [Betaproteobacteria bacterium]